MENPFSYTGIVRGKAFCNRQTEQTELLEFIKRSQNVLLYSHRRYGKSSLIYKLFNRLERQRPKINTLYVELYGTLSEKDFVAAILASLNQIESKLEKLVGNDIVLKNDDYKIQDVMFGKWIQTFLFK